VVTAGAAAAGTDPDPFGSGLRWSFGSDAADPWIPRGAAFAADGELLLTAPAIGAHRLLLHATSGLGAPADPIASVDLPGTLGSVRVAAGDDLGELYCARQLPEPDAAHRRTWVERRGAAGPLPALAAEWTHDFGFLVNGGVELAASPDGETVVAAVFDSATGRVVVDWLDAGTGALRARHELGADGLRRIALSADGTTLAVGAGSRVAVLRPELPAPLFARVQTGAAEAIALSGDGRVLAVGDLDRLDVLVDAGAGHALVRSIALGAEWAVRAAWSADASLLAVLAWEPTSGGDVHLRAWDAASWRLVVDLRSPGRGGGPQNFPVGLSVTPDGSRLAAAWWGTADAEPEALLLAPGLAEPLLRIDLPGSPEALALDASGTRVALAWKHAHANQFATTGEVGLFDTGERRLQLLGAVRPGGSLDLTLREPGRAWAIALVGLPLPAPLPLGGGLGVLHIDPLAPRAALPAPLDPSGRASWSLPLAATPALVGTRLAAQAVVGGGGGARLNPEVLRIPLL